jgi:D-alanyl-D-alanine carboxypeptidase
MIEKKEIFKLALLSIAIFFLFGLVKNQQLSKGVAEAYVKNYTLKKDREMLQSIVDNTDARGVIVYDLNNNEILASKNIDSTYSLASLTKIVTATIVYEKDRTLLNDIRHMLKVSSNEEAVQLAQSFAPDEATQAAYMNDFTKGYHMYFRNASGLDTESDLPLPGGEAKPLDLIDFIKKYYTAYPELFDQTIIESKNTNVIADDLSFLSAGKTGFTNISGGNLFVSIQKGLGREIFILVLSSTEKNRFVDVQQIANFLVQSSI